MSGGTQNVHHPKKRPGGRDRAALFASAWFVSADEPGMPKMRRISRGPRPT